jgi:hypothetical protein
MEARGKGLIAAVLLPLLVGLVLLAVEYGLLKEPSAGSTTENYEAVDLGTTTTNQTPAPELTTATSEDLEVQQPPAPTSTTPRSIRGSLAYNAQVAGFGSQRVPVSGTPFYTVPLILETIQNDPSSELSLHFLVDNKTNREYQLTLSLPYDTAVAVDNEGTEYSFLSAQDVESPSGLKIPAFSRRRFVVSFQPLTIPRESLQVRLVFEQERAGGSWLSSRPKSVQISDIPIYKIGR